MFSVSFCCLGTIYLNISLFNKSNTISGVEADRDIKGQINC